MTTQRRLLKREEINNRTRNVQYVSIDSTTPKCWCSRQEDPKKKSTTRSRSRKQ